MKNEAIYNLLILFVIFLFIKKLISIVVEIKFPTYNDLKNASEFWKILVKIRSFFEIITFIATSYFLLNFNLNFFIRAIFTIVFIHSILYFLVDQNLIYLIIKNPSKETKDIVYILNTYGDSIENLIIAIFAIYALLTIFLK